MIEDSWIMYCSYKISLLEIPFVIVFDGNKYFIERNGKTIFKNKYQHLIYKYIMYHYENCTIYEDENKYMEIKLNEILFGKKDNFN